jgi:hypothetical protein
MNPVWKLKFLLFNIEGYGEFFSGITPFRQKTKILVLMVPHSNWLWTVTTDPVWHFLHQNVTKYIKVSCYSYNMNIMQYFGKYSSCTRCTCYFIISFKIPSIPHDLPFLRFLHACITKVKMYVIRFFNN